MKLKKRRKKKPKKKKRQTKKCGYGYYMIRCGPFPSFGKLEGLGKQGFLCIRACGVFEQASHTSTAESPTGSSSAI